VASIAGIVRPLRLLTWLLLALLNPLLPLLLALFKPLLPLLLTWLLLALLNPLLTLLLALFKPLLPLLLTWLLLALLNPLLTWQLVLPVLVQLTRLIPLDIFLIPNSRLIFFLLIKDALIPLASLLANLLLENFILHQTFIISFSKYWILPSVISAGKIAFFLESVSLAAGKISEPSWLAFIEAPAAHPVTK